jgi:hypothetical protein
MTSRRGTKTRGRWLCFAAAGLVTALFAGCASLPEDQPIMEQLDSETGVTITRLGKPVEIFRETFLQKAPGRFGFIAPFETNLMGTRELYLWVAVPIDPAANAEPTVAVDGVALTLGTAARAADIAGLRKSPYKIPTPWSAMYYYKIDAEVVARLGQASEILVSLFEATKDGAAKVEFATHVVDSRLKEFAAR